MSHPADESECSIVDGVVKRPLVAVDFSVQPAQNLHPRRVLVLAADPRDRDREVDLVLRVAEAELVLLAGREEGVERPGLALSDLAGQVVR